MIWRLIRLWRRLAHCDRGEHRETIECVAGTVLQLRCVDCGRTVALGWIARGTNTLRPHHPWEHDDA